MIVAFCLGGFGVLLLLLLVIAAVALVGSILTVVLLPALLVGTVVGAVRVWRGTGGVALLVGCAGFLALWATVAWTLA